MRDLRKTHRALQQWPQRLDDVPCSCHEGRAFFQEMIGTLGTGIEWVSGHGENEATLLVGGPGRRQCARTPRRLDDDYSK